MMKQLLNNLVNMTAHREHTRLECSVISALHELTPVSQVRVLEILSLRDELFVQEKVLSREGQLCAPVEYPYDDAKEPLSLHPAIQACILDHKTAHSELVGTKHVLWLPVWLHGEINTCLEITNTKAFDDSTMEIIGGIFKVYCNYKNLLDYSERDALTGLFNRKTFDDQFTRNVLSISSQESHQLENNERRYNENIKSHWLAVVDIDHFKQVNDQFGHLYGDEVLILVANILRASFRSHDRIFRFGGEEFVILLRSTTLDDAKQIFDRFRQNVENYQFPQISKVTVSLGFVGISYETPVVILGHADQALYHAKKNGRNRVCFYDDLVSSGALSSGISSNDRVEFF